MLPQWLDSLRAFWREVRHPTPMAVLAGFPSSVGLLRALLPALPAGVTLSVYEPDTDAMRALFAAHDLSQRNRHAGEFAEVPLSATFLDTLAALERPEFSLAQAYFVLAPGPQEVALVSSFDSEHSVFCSLTLGRQALADVADATGATLAWPDVARAAG